MADFTPEEVIQVVEDGRKCVGADLRNANLSGADLSGADLTNANLVGAMLRLAKYNANTKWTLGFDPEAAGAVLVDD